MNIVKFFIPNSFYRKLKFLKFRIKQSSIFNIYNMHCFVDNTPGSIKSANLYRQLFKRSRTLYIHEYFYTFDPFVGRNTNLTQLASITPDYHKIIKSNIFKIKDSILKTGLTNSTFKSVEIKTIEAILDKANTIAKKQYKDKRKSKLANIISSFLYRDCLSLDEALQKILFYNGLFWQSGHWHNGLGRLDYVLNEYYIDDLNNKTESRESAKEKIKNFILTLGAQTKFKSFSLVGDTGQYILLGGIDEYGNNVENDLTIIILEIFSEIHIPDPKLIIRVNEKTTNQIWNLCIKCLLNGSGSPLFMNETLVMNKMVDFGYEKCDVWNVGTSACWEPLIIGKSADQNNPFCSVLACDALHKVLHNNKRYESFDLLLDDTCRALYYEVEKVVKTIDYDYSPLMSLFTDYCIMKNIDFSHGGSKYMYQGVQLLSFPNLINSLLNVKEYVYNRKLVTLDDCRFVIDNNYNGKEDLRQLFLNANDLKFGSNNCEVINICQTLLESISDSVKKLHANGHELKFGLSSSNYIQMSYGKPATLDGRKANTPYGVHISPVSSKIDLNEIINFANSLKYPTNCLNGNVVDFILPSAYKNNSSKLISIIKNAFSNGLFELQINILDKETLIDAKQHPEKYPSLIVRVWGFSAYFNDLPIEYKDNLIARAETYESA